MKTQNLWKLSLTYPNGTSVVRFKRSDKLSIGSAYGSTVVLPDSYPNVIFELSSLGEVLALGDGVECKDLESSKSFILKSSMGDLSVQVEDVTKSHGPLKFEPVRAASSESSEMWTLWHYVGSVLLETESLSTSLDPSKDPFVCLKSGVEVQWQGLDSRLVLKMPSGEMRSLKAQRSERGPYKASLDDHSFVICRSSSLDTYAFTPKDYVEVKDPFNKHFVAFLATWLLIMGFLNFGTKWLPQPDLDQIAQEELPELMKKVEIAKKESKQAKQGQGGNGMSGGGGVNTEANDPRGGGGFVSDEVVVADLQSLSGGSGVFEALGALDKQMAANQVQTAALGPSNATANSILGALGALGGGGNKKSGGGLGLGGVGTKGFGGGGGVGVGNGFGTGTGSGLGLGNGPRRLSFETGDSDVRGGLDRSEVDAVVRQNIAQIRFCYNRGLRSNPDLSGRVTSNFVIGGDGRVKASNIRQSSLGVAAVEDCIRSKVATWNFPKPRGGGEVTVNYPFMLRAN